VKTQENTQAEAARAGFLQSFNLAHAHIDAEFIALAGNGFGVACAGFDG